MGAKEKKTEAELAALIMQHIREHPEWSDVAKVTIFRPEQQAPLHPNWQAEFTMNDNRIRPEGASVFVQQLQTQFDLV
jgi:hypothetical protein